MDLHRLAQVNNEFPASTSSATRRHDRFKRISRPMIYCVRHAYVGVFHLSFGTFCHNDTSIIKGNVRPQFWMWRACHDVDTHKYLCDLAQALTAQLNGHEYDSDEPLHWSSVMLKSSPVWSEAYAFVLEKCGVMGTLEHDKQIGADVQRTFGRPSLRKQTRKTIVVDGTLFVDLICVLGNGSKYRCQEGSARSCLASVHCDTY